MIGALLVITDGRADYLARSVESIHLNLRGDIVERWMFDDSGDDDYRAELARRYPEFRLIDGGPRQGFGGAIRAAWAHLQWGSTARWILHCEGDFVYPDPVDLGLMVNVLDNRPHLAQMALVRQPWNAEEIAAGGLVSLSPESFEEFQSTQGHEWMEHRLWFTTNPSIYRRTILTVGWPEGPNSEGVFTHRLLTGGTPETPGDQIAFGYWGLRNDPPRALHIGVDRAGSGY